MTIKSNQDLATEGKAISADELAAIARQGVERAIAARGEITELTAEQVQDVSGGIRLGDLGLGSILRKLPPVIFGLIWNPTGKLPTGLASLPAKLS